MVRAGLFVAGVVLAFTFSTPVRAEEVGCVTTAWKMLGANHRVCVEAFDDPKVPGVACHLSQARAGGVSGTLGLAEDPSRFSIACRQVGPITLPEKLRENEEVFTADTSILFLRSLLRLARLLRGFRSSAHYVSPPFRRLAAQHAATFKAGAWNFC